MLCPRISSRNPFSSPFGRSAKLVHRCARSFLLITLVACGILTGCKTPIYTTRSLPIEYQAPLVSPHSNIEFETASASENPPSPICPGDLLAITIGGNNASRPVEPLTARVANDGTVFLPQIGKVAISGSDRETARGRITTAVIEKGIYEQPKVDVAVTMRGTCHINVAGAVVHPGPIELQNGSNDLVAAIRSAGGLSDNAGTQVEIVHRGEKTNLAAIRDSHSDKTAGGDVQLASLTENTKPDQASPAEKTKLDLRTIAAATTSSSPLEDGDTVTIAPKDKCTFRMEGLAKSPADIELKAAKDTHVLDAIEMAGARPSQLADLVLVIRQLPKMEEPIIISVSLARAKHDDDENLRLAEGDIVLVRRTMTSMVGGAFGGMIHSPGKP